MRGPEEGWDQLETWQERRQVLCSQCLLHYIREIQFAARVDVLTRGQHPATVVVILRE